MYKKEIMKTVTVVSASWCTQCDSLKNQLTAMGIKFDVIDADTSASVIKHFSIRSLPFTIIYESGEVIKTVIGNNAKQIQAILA